MKSRLEGRWAELLKTVVEINSGTGNFSGAEKVRQVLIPEFQALGFQCTTYDLDSGHKLLGFEYRNSKPDFLCVGHLDTVFPEHSKFQNLTVLEDRLVGPGVIDMKGGVVLLLNLLHDLCDRVDLKRIRILLNDDEEIGSPFSAEKLKELGTGIPYGLVFEPGLPDRSVVTSESGVLWAEMEVRGQAAHAGLEHQKGINAGLELAHQMVKLSEITDYSKNLTFSLGVLQGGTRANVVCDHAHAKIDIRYTNEEDLKEVFRRFDDAKAAPIVRSAETGATPTTEVRTLALVPSFTTQSSEALLPFLRAAEKTTGQKVGTQHVGYTSDANHLAQTGMSLLVGLGPYGGGMHTHHEFMLLSSYQERLSFGQALIQEIFNA